MNSNVHSKSEILELTFVFYFILVLTFHLQTHNYLLSQQIKSIQHFVIWEAADFCVERNIDKQIINIFQQVAELTVVESTPSDIVHRLCDKTKHMAQF